MRWKAISGGIVALLFLTACGSIPLPTNCPNIDTRPIVNLLITDKARKTGVTGSGIMITRNGYILAASHLAERIQPTSKIQLIYNGRFGSTPQVVDTIPALDLALLKVEGTYAHVSLPEKMRLPHEGETACAIGVDDNSDTLGSEGVIGKTRLVHIPATGTPLTVHEFWATLLHVGGLSGGIVLSSDGVPLGLPIMGGKERKTYIYEGIEYTEHSRILLFVPISKEFLRSLFPVLAPEL